MLEMVMVLSTMGFIAAIAVPRLSSAAENTRTTSIKATVRNLQFAVEMYAAEHFDRSPAENADGSIQSSAAVVMARLTQRTDDNGNVVVGGAYGPYLKAWPTNTQLGKSTLRVAGAAAGAGTHGWQISPVSRIISSDGPALTNAPVGGQAVVAAMTVEPD